MSGVIPKIESFTHKSLINELSLYLHSNGNMLIQPDSLLYQLKVSSYLNYKAKNLVELPRYKFKEFIAELERIMAGNDDHAINQIFLAKITNYLGNFGYLFQLKFMELQLKTKEISGIFQNLFN